MQNFNSSSSYKYQTEDEVPQAAIQKYISERNKLKSPSSGYIDPEKDSELRDAMLKGWFDPASEDNEDTPITATPEAEPQTTAPVTQAVEPQTTAQSVETTTASPQREEVQLDFSGLYDEVEQPQAEQQQLDFSGLYDAEPIKTPKPDEPGYWPQVGDALVQGYNDMTAATQSTAYLAGLVDARTVAKNIVENERARKEVPLYVTQFRDKIQQEGKDVSDAEGFIDTTVEVFDLVGETFLAAAKNPDATLYSIAESAALSIPSTAAGATGAAAGFLSPAPGGTALGLAAGTGIGTFATEAGAYLNGELASELRKQGRDMKSLTEEDVIAKLSDPSYINAVKSKAVKAGLSTAVVEALFAGVAGKIVKRGADLAEVANTVQTKQSKFARGGAAFTVESLGEPAGVLAQQAATGEEFNYGDAALEGITGVAQSAGTTATATAFNEARSLATGDTPAATPNQPRKPVSDDLESVFADGEDDIPVDPLQAELDQPSIMTEDVPETPPTEPTQGERDYQAEVEGAQAIVDQYPDLQDAAGAIDEASLINSNIPQELFLIARDIPADQRTAGQQALVDYAKSLEAPSKSDVEQIADNLNEPTPMSADMPDNIDAELADEDRYGVVISMDPALLTEADKQFIADYEAANGTLADQMAAEYEAKPATAKTPRELLQNDPDFINDDNLMDDVTANEIEQELDAANTPPIDRDPNEIFVLDDGAEPKQPKQAEPAATEQTGVTPTRFAEVEDEVIDSLPGGLFFGLGIKDGKDKAGDLLTSTLIPETIPTLKRLDMVRQSSVEGNTADVVDMEMLKELRDEKRNRDNVKYEKRRDNLVEQYKGDLTGDVEKDAAFLESKGENWQIAGSAAKAYKAQLDATATDREALDAAANEAATSPTNDRPMPTKAQQDAGNYKKGNVKLGGLDIAIENPKGSTRSGTDAKGKKWSTTMKDHYGYVKGTKGADGDPIDVFIGDDPDSDAVYLIDQVDPETGDFDEVKVVVGAKNQRQAKMFYSRNYSKGWKGAGKITKMTRADFEQWVKSGDTAKPASESAVLTEATTALTPLPESVAMGPTSFKPKPIGGTLYRETSGEGLATLLREASSNSSDKGAVTSVFVADNKDLATGQGENKGVEIEFDGNLVSGDRQTSKPGAAIATGNEFKTDFIGEDAIRSFTLPKGSTLRGVSKVFAKQKFNMTTNDNGSVTYTRKDLETPAPRPLTEAEVEAQRIEDAKPLLEKLQDELKAVRATPQPKRMPAKRARKEKIETLQTQIKEEKARIKQEADAAKAEEKRAKAADRSEAQKARTRKAQEVKDTDSLATAVAKKGGLDKAAWEAEGVDPAFMKRNGNDVPVVIGKPLFRAKGGLLPSDVSEIARDLGYAVNPDDNEAVTMIIDELNGEPKYTPAGQAAIMDAEAVDQFDLEAERDGTEAETVTPDTPTPTMADVENPDEFTLTDDMGNDPNQDDLFTGSAPPPMKPENAPIFDDDFDDILDDMFEDSELAPEPPKPDPVLDDLEQSPLEKTLKNNTVDEVLQGIVARSEGTIYSTIAAALVGKIPDKTTIKVYSQEEIQAGASAMARSLRTGHGGFQHNTFEVGINGDSGINDETVLHELLHSVTVDLIKTGSLVVNRGTELGDAVSSLIRTANETIREIQQLYNDGDPTVTEQWDLLRAATQDSTELISYAFTSPEFQSVLQNIHIKNESAWSRMTKKLLKVLGLGADSQNALAKILEQGNAIMEADYRRSQKKRAELTAVIDSSMNNAKPTINKQMEIAQLEEQIALDETLRDQRLDIGAGRRIKDNKAKVQIAQQEIQDERAKKPYFKKGEDPIDTMAGDILAEETQYMTLKERITSALDRSLNWWREAPLGLARIASGAAFIERDERNRFSGRRSAEESMTAAYHRAANAKVAASMAVHKFGVKMVNGTLTPDYDKPGLLQILEEVSKHGTRHLRRFELYLVINRSRELLEQGRENLVSQEQIDMMDKWLEKNPNAAALFKRQQAAFAKWNRSMLQIAVDTGYINEQDAFGGFKFVDDEGNDVLGPDGTFFESVDDAMRVANELGVKGQVEQVDGWYADAYVPFYRVGDDGSKDTKGPKSGGKVGEVGAATKKLQGGVNKIPVLDNIVRNAEFLVSSSMKVQTMQQIEDVYKGTLFEDYDADEDPSMEVPKMVDPKQLRKEYNDIKAAAENDGEPMPELSDAELQRWAKLRQSARPNAGDVATVWRNGRPKYYKITDPDLLNVVRSIGPYQSSTLIKILGMPTKLLQKSITVTPAFLARSFVREVQNAFIVNGKGGFNPLKTIKNAFKGFANVVKPDNEWMNKMMAAGFVNYNTYTSVTPENLRKDLEKAGVKKGTFKNIVQGQMLGLAPMWRLYQQIAIASEHANRKAVYDSYIESGATEEEAMYQALDIMNFARRSDYKAMEAILAVTPFLNPRIQGLDRLIRGYKEDRKTFAMKAGMLAVGSTMLALWNWEENEEEMNKLKDEDKALNYHFFIDTGSGEKQHFRIPKGFEIGQITGTFPEFFVEQLNADTAEPASKAVTRFMKTIFGIQLPQVFAPIADVATNTNSFTQRDIITFGQQFLMPSEQYDPWTSKLIVDISQSQPDFMPDWLRSPKQLEYLVKGYTGSIGGMMLEGIDTIYRATGNAPDLPAKKLSEMYLIRDYYRTGLKQSTKQVDLFYDMLTEVGTLSMSLKSARDADDKERYRELKADNSAKLGARKRLNKYSNRIRKISNEIKEIRAGSNSPEFKARKIDRLVEKRNAIASEAVDKYFFVFD